MENSGRSHIDNWVDFKQELTVFIWDCFNSFKSEGELDSDRIYDVKSSIENLIDFFDYKVINYEEFRQWLKYLKFLDSGEFKDISIFEENFNKFIKMECHLDYEDTLKNMDESELRTEIKSFILDYEFLPIKSVSFTSKERDKANILMEATIAQIQIHLDSLDTLKTHDNSEGKAENKHFWENVKPRIQREVDSLYMLRCYADDLQNTIKKLYDNEDDIPEKFRDWRLNIVLKLE